MKTQVPGAPVWRSSVLLLAALAAAVSAAPLAAQSVEREMFVSVLDRDDRPVLTLGAPDFVVREDGRVREVLRARRSSDVIDIALLVDTSQALYNQVADVRKGVEAFIARMRPQAQIAIIGIGDRPTLYADYTNSAEALARGVGRLFPIIGAGAYTLDAVSDVLRGFEQRAPERAAVVLLWAGGREFSNESDTTVVPALVARGVALHVIVIGTGVPPDSRTSEGRNRENLFDRGTTATGGRRVNILSSMAIADALERLADELLGQYRITFARPDALIPPEKTEVSVRPAGLTARGILIASRPKGK